MSTLAMILTAAMGVPGDVPERESGQIAETQPLALSGEWKGSWSNSSGNFKVIVTREKVSLADNRAPIMVWIVRDEGEGRIQLNYWMLTYLGIYRQEGDRLLICLREASQGRPTSFRVSDGQDLLILHRVKPRK